MRLQAVLLVVCWLGLAACGGGAPTCTGAASGEVCQDSACSGSSKKYRLCVFGDPAQRCSQASYATSAGVLKATCVCSGPCADGSSAALASYNECVSQALKEVCP